MSTQFDNRAKTRKRIIRLMCLLCAALATLCASSSALAQGGNFSAGVNYAVPGQGGIAVGNFQGSSKPPGIVVANGDNTVSILLGNGDGTLQPQYTVTALPSSSNYLTESVAVADFNGDGYPDLAVLCVSSVHFNTSSPSTIFGTVNILLNDGTGHFGAPTVITLNTTTETGPSVILADRFGTDTNLDLAVLNTGSGNVSILRGNGDGTFGVPVDYSTGTQAAGLAIGDLNKDGYLDLAVAGTSGTDGVVSVLLGKNDGTFGTPVNWITSSASCHPLGCSPPTAVAIGDLNGDGKQDLAVNNGFLGGLFVLLGNGDGTFQEPALPAGPEAGSNTGQCFLVAGDFNGDGKLDLAMGIGGIYPKAPNLLIFLGNGDGTFPSPLLLNVGTADPYSSASGLVVTDLNGDKSPDLVLATNSGFAAPSGYNAVTVVLNCALQCSNTALSSSSATSAFNQEVTFTATVTAGNVQATAKPTGFVVFQDTVQPFGGTPTTTTLGTAKLSGGSATFAYSGLPTGMHSISASYQGDANFNPSTSPAVAQTVTAAPTNTAINSTPNPSSPGQSVTFTATVTPSTSGVPTGSVVFSDNGTQSVSVQLGATGSASFTTSALTTGTHFITWSYSGDSNFLSSSSPVLTQIVGNNAAPFALSSSPTSAAVSAGQSATFSITVASVPTLKTAISFACSGLPAMSTCQFNPASVNPGGANLMTQLMITTTAAHSGLFRFRWPTPARSIPALVLSIGGLLVMLLRAAYKEVLGEGQRSLLAGGAVLILLALAVTTLGCGGSSGSSSNPGTPSGISQVVVTGTSGNATQSVTLTLTVE